MTQKKKGPAKGTKYSKNKPFEFGQKLYALRKKRGLTQQELAKKMAASVRAISYYEREAENPTMEIIEKVSSALGVGKAFFLEDTAVFTENTDNQNIIRSLKQRMEKVGTLERSQQKALVQVIDGLLAAH